MIRYLKFLLVTAGTIFVLSETCARADDPTELKTQKDSSVIIVNFIAARPDCTTNPAPQPLPSLREKPAHGSVGVQIVVTDVAAAGGCPDRKVPSFLLFYVPAPDFVGVDTIKIDVDPGNSLVTTSTYRITVQAPESK